MPAKPTASTPPGAGTPQTQSRNARRRKKRMHDKLAVLGVKDAPVAAAHKKAAVAARLQPDTHTPGPAISTADVPMASLSNKNKRRGFKQAAVSRAPKIVFDAEAPAPASVFTTVVPWARLVPPSERALPANVFVTSVDVEAGLRKKGKDKGRVECWEGAGEGDEEEEAVVLDYGGADEDKKKELDGDGAAELEVDWEAVEALFDSCPVVCDTEAWKAQMVPGTVLGWTVGRCLALIRAC